MADVRQQQNVTQQPHDSVTYEVEGLASDERRSAQYLAHTDAAVLGVCHLAPGECISPTRQEDFNGLWLVKTGKVRLTTDAGEEIGELESGDGAVVPRGCTYAFEALDPGDGTATELLQFHAAYEKLPVQMSKVKRQLGLA